MDLSSFLPPRAPQLPVVRSILGCIAAHMALGGAESLPCSLALLGVVVAAVERRHQAMLILAGIAAGLAPFGLAMLPLAIGVGIKRRAGFGLLSIPAAAGVTMLLVGTYPGMPVATGAWELADSDPRWVALLSAMAIGGAAWFTAHVAGKPFTGSMIVRAAPVAAIGFVAIGPAPVEAMAIVIVLALLAGDRRIAAMAIASAVSTILALPVPAALIMIGALALAGRPLARRAANDNPVGIRMTGRITPSAA